MPDCRRGETERHSAAVLRMVTAACVAELGQPGAVVAASPTYRRDHRRPVSSAAAAALWRASIKPLGIQLSKESTTSIRVLRVPLFQLRWAALVGRRRRAAAVVRVRWCWPPPTPRRSIASCSSSCCRRTRLRIVGFSQPASGDSPCSLLSTTAAEVEVSPATSSNRPHAGDRPRGERKSKRKNEEWWDLLPPASAGIPTRAEAA